MSDDWIGLTLIATADENYLWADIVPPRPISIRGAYIAAFLQEESEGTAINLSHGHWIMVSETREQVATLLGVKLTPEAA